MEVILSGIAILLSLVSLFFLGTWSASNKSVGKLRRRISVLEEDINAVHSQINSLADQLGPTAALLAQAASASNEISTLKVELGYIKRDLHANSQIVSTHSQAITAIEQKQSAWEAAKATPLESIQQELTPFSEFNNSAEGIKPLPSLASIPWLDAEQTTQVKPAEDFTPVAEPPAPAPKPYEQVAQQYQDAIDRGDRQALRQLQFKELNITNESEDSLLKGSSRQATKLEAVLGGGSYMVFRGEGRYWLFPTAQTLDSFSMNQPQKGIFDYEHEMLSRPVVKKPAEVREESDYWVVIALGVISVPG